MKPNLSKSNFILFWFSVILLAGCNFIQLEPENSLVPTVSLPTPTLAPPFTAFLPTNTPRVNPTFTALVPTSISPTLASDPTENPTVNVVVNVNRDIHPISPLIYGVSIAPKEVLQDLRPTLNSWGGNPSTRYNWKLGNAWNAGRDWFYQNGSYNNSEGSVSDNFVREAEEYGIEARLAYPALGWVAKNSDPNSCSFPQPDGTCGDADGASCSEPGNIANPNRANVPSDSASIVEWMQHLYEEQGFNIRFLAFDNEPELWGHTHYDVHPKCTTYDEILSLYLEYATAVREVAPKAELVGPVTCCWYYYWNSAAGDEDKANHDNLGFLPWFLENVRLHDEEEGRRSLDVLDIHFYPEGVYNEDVDRSTSALRLRSTRSLWDITYQEETWIEEPIYLIPRMQQMIEDYYPGTKLGISEWNWGADNSMNGALAIADVLGIFGKVELYYAAYWDYPAMDSPGYNAFKIYTNYDGTGSRFGDTSVWTESTDSVDITSYAALDSGSGNLHLIMINKNPTDEIVTQVKLEGYTSLPEVEMYRYDNNNPDEIVQSKVDDASDTFNISLPAYSITLLVFQPQVP